MTKVHSAAPSALEAAAGPRRWAGLVGTVAVRLQQLFGALMVLTLVWAILSFPAYKRMLIGYVPVVAGVALAVALGMKGPRTWLTGRLTRPGDVAFALFVVGLAVAVRVAAVFLLAQEPISDHLAYHQTAVRLLRGTGYGQSLFPPGMPFWLAGVYSIFGVSILAAQLANALVGGLFAWITLEVGRRLVPVPAARLAALLIALFPSLVLYATTLGYGPLLGCAILGAVAVFLRRAAPAAHPWWYVGLIGLMLGVVTLLKPIGLLMPVVFGLSYWFRGTSLARSLRNGVIMLAATYAVITPWIIRNTLHYGEYTSVVAGPGEGLWAANNPDATGRYMRVPPTPGMSQGERSRFYWNRAWAFISEHPDRFLLLILPKCTYQWGTSSTVMASVSADRMNPHLEAGLKLCINTAWTLVCAFFIIAIWRDGLFRSAKVFWPLVCLLAYFWGIHLFFEAQSRYHLPFLPVLLIGAGCAWLRCGVRAADGTSGVPA